MVLLRQKVVTFAELVKFEHTIFALPFAYIGALLASKNVPSWTQIFLITLAMVGARSTAMACNRLIDCEIDKLNPRTAGRHLPRGLVKEKEVMIFVGFSLLFFLYAVYCLSPRHLVYMPLIILFLVGYSYTKRFTWLSHLFLGITIGFAPIGGWVAVTQKIEIPSLLLGLVVAFWVAGFDIFYAALDVDFDREYGLYSLPLYWGNHQAFFLAKIFHGLVVLLLLIIFFLLDLGMWYLFGVLQTAILLIVEHGLVSPRNLTHLNAAFFSVNGLISIQLLVFTLVDVLL